MPETDGRCLHLRTETNCINESRLARAKLRRANNVPAGELQIRMQHQELFCVWPIAPGTTKTRACMDSPSNQRKKNAVLIPRLTAPTSNVRQHQSTHSHPAPGTQMNETVPRQVRATGSIMQCTEATAKAQMRTRRLLPRPRQVHHILHRILKHSSDMPNLRLVSSRIT